jgi:hypothetical protein
LCDEVQGYLLGVPGEIGQFRHLTHGDVPEPQPASAAAQPKLRVVAK